MMLLFWLVWVCLETTEILELLVCLEIRELLELRETKALLVQQAQMETLEQLVIQDRRAVKEILGLRDQWETRVLRENLEILVSETQAFRALLVIQASRDNREIQVLLETQELQVLREM